MSWRWLLLSFNGRLNRSGYWLGVLMLVGALVVACVIGGSLLFVLTSFLLLYPSLALGAKRLRDREKSMIWLLVFVVLPMLVPSIGGFTDDGSVVTGFLDLIGLGLSVWALVELGCLRGPVGPNRFGPDPLEQPALAGV